MCGGAEKVGRWCPLTSSGAFEEAVPGVPMGGGKDGQEVGVKGLISPCLTGSSEHGKGWGPTEVAVGTFDSWCSGASVCVCGGVRRGERLGVPRKWGVCVGEGG